MTTTGDVPKSDEEAREMLRAVGYRSEPIQKALCRLYDLDRKEGRSVEAAFDAALTVFLERTVAR